MQEEEREREREREEEQNRNRIEKEQKIAKKPKYQTYNSLSSQIMSAIEYWNNDIENYKGMVRDRTMLITEVSNASELKSILDKYSLDEVKSAIDNLKFCWNSIPPLYRVSNFNRLMTKSLHLWIDEANPRDRYESVQQLDLTKEYNQEPRTIQERLYFNKLKSKDENSDIWSDNQENELNRLRELRDQSIGAIIQEATF